MSTRCGECGDYAAETCRPRARTEPTCARGGRAMRRSGVAGADNPPPRTRWACVLRRGCARAQPLACRKQANESPPRPCTSTCTVRRKERLPDSSCPGRAADKLLARHTRDNLLRARSSGHPHARRIAGRRSRPEYGARPKARAAELTCASRSSIARDRSSLGERKHDLASGEPGQLPSLLVTGYSSMAPSPWSRRN